MVHVQAPQLAAIKDVIRFGSDPSGTPGMTAKQVVIQLKYDLPFTVLSTAWTRWTTGRKRYQ